MPELPEVETIKLSLEKKILGLTIKDIQILNPKSFLGEPESIKGAKIIQVWRRAKVLGIDLLPSLRGGSKTRRGNLDSGQARMTLLFHLKMSGQVIYMGESRFVGGHPTKDMLGSMPNKHTRAIFTFKSQGVNESKSQEVGKLYFNDQRKFGWIKVIKNSELGMMNYGYKVKLGPEPLEKEFTWELFESLIVSHLSQPVKVAILDPSVVAGVGNIYACEALFLAKIDPKKKVGQLIDQEIKSLHRAIQQVLRDGIKLGGSTKTHFVDSDGKKGLFLDYANVYNRVGKPCKVCGTKIEKIKLGGRGTFLCPNCQKST